MDEVVLLDALRGQLGTAVSFRRSPEQLMGGFYTANYLLHVDSGPPGWERPVVLRLFPTHAPPGQAERESVVQDLAVAGGVPAPSVLLYRKGSRIDGREWFVMAYLAGRPLMGGVGIADLVRLVPSLRRVAPLTANAQLALHRVDPAPLIEAVGEREAGIGCWLDLLGQKAETVAPGLGEGWQWLVDHQPPARPAVLCHGDLWGGNLLVDHGRLSGVIDWTLATAAEPAFDVGFTTMSLTLAPVPVPPAIRAGLRVVSRSMARRYLRLYRRGSAVDLSAVPFYEALRCALELVPVIDYRLAANTGSFYDGPRPAWDWVADDMIRYFYERTGVTLTVPTPAGS